MYYIVLIFSSISIIVPWFPFACFSEDVVVTSKPNLSINKPNLPISFSKPAIFSQIKTPQKLMEEHQKKSEEERIENMKKKQEESKKPQGQKRLSQVAALVALGVSVGMTGNASANDDSVEIRVGCRFRIRAGQAL